MPRRIVVHDDQSESVENGRTLHYLARIHRRVIDRPALHFVGNKGTSQLTQEWVHGSRVQFRVNL